MIVNGDTLRSVRRLVDSNETMTEFKHVIPVYDKRRKDPSVTVGICKKKEGIY